MRQGGREIVHVDAYCVELLAPSEAGRYDPPMQEWLDLPAGDACPECGSQWWGTDNPIGYFLVRHCHDQHARGCNAKFRPEVDARTIQMVVGALCGEKRRLGRACRHKERVDAA